MELSKEQHMSFNKYINGDNIFITGPGGTGKSALIKSIYTRAISNKKKIQVCALTGCAAVLLNCNAKTIHSWAGIGLANGTIEEILKKIKINHFLKASWLNIDILVIDEVSMMSLKLFNLLNAIGKQIRKNTKPFGGIQVIFTGDFYQLPPVGNKDDTETTRFCFESEDWDVVFHKNDQIELKKIFRQTDELYVGILNQVREGKIKKKSDEILQQYVNRTSDPSLLIRPTKLFPTKSKVDAINSTKINLLNGEEREFDMKYHTDLEFLKTEIEVRKKFSEKDMASELDYLSGNLICDKIIRLKTGCQVMCVVNKQLDRGVEVCNGSQGIVLGFCPITKCPIVKYNNGVKMTMVHHFWPSEKIPGVGVSQVPLILAWALTIHKSQGTTMDFAEIDIGSGIFECGQTYVALSRVKSLNGLYLTSYDVSRIKINKKVQVFYEQLRKYHETNLSLEQEKPADTESNIFLEFQYKNTEEVAIPDISTCGEEGANAEELSSELQKDVTTTKTIYFTR